MEIIVLSLAVWRLTSLLVLEDGPFDLFAVLRHRIGVYYDEYSNALGKNAVAKGLTCIWCTSVWVSFLASFFMYNSVNVHQFIINWLAISTLAIMISETIDRIKDH